MTAAPSEQPKPPPKIVVPLRMSAPGKAICQKLAAEAGYKHYTAWMRDVLQAEANNPKHKPRPKRETP